MHTKGVGAELRERQPAREQIKPVAKVIIRWVRQLQLIREQLVCCRFWLSPTKYSTTPPVCVAPSSIQRSCLLSIVGTLGLPTIFFTHSAADLQWSELAQLICPDNPNSRAAVPRQLSRTQPLQTTSKSWSSSRPCPRSY